MYAAAARRGCVRGAVSAHGCPAHGYPSLVFGLGVSGRGSVFRSTSKKDRQLIIGARSRPAPTRDTFSPTACHFLMRAHSPGDNNRTLEKGPSLNLFSFTRSTNARALNGNRGSIRTQSALSRCERPIQHIHFYPVPTQGQPKPSER